MNLKFLAIPLTASIILAVWACETVARMMARTFPEFRLMVCDFHSFRYAQLKNKFK